jgi:hypothetical protein
VTFVTPILNRRAGVMWNVFMTSAIASPFPALPRCRDAYHPCQGTRRASGAFSDYLCCTALSLSRSVGSMRNSLMAFDGSSLGFGLDEADEFPLSAWEAIDAPASHSLTTPAGRRSRPSRQSCPVPLSNSAARPRACRISDLATTMTTIC